MMFKSRCLFALAAACAVLMCAVMPAQAAVPQAVVMTATAHDAQAVYTFASQAPVCALATFEASECVTKPVPKPKTRPIPDSKTRHGWPDGSPGVALLDSATLSERY